MNFVTISSKGQIAFPSKTKGALLLGMIWALIKASYYDS